MPRPMIRGNLSDQVLHNWSADGKPWTLKRSVLRLVCAFASAAIGFAATCFLLRLLIQNPTTLYAEIRSEKLVLAAQWASVVSVAVFGTSHVDCGFDPRAFDAAFNPGSSKATSLNLSVSGGSQIEQTAVAGEFVRLVAASVAARNSHLLLMEANSGVNFTTKFLTHPRAINIYDFQALRLALDFSDPQLGKMRALGRSLVAVVDYLLHSTNVGMLSNQIFRPPLNPQLVANETVADRRGLSPPPPSALDERDTRNVNALMASLTSTPVAQPAAITPGLCAEAIELSRHRQSANVAVVYFVTPKLSDLRSYDTYPDSLACGGLNVPIVNVALPAVHPELYDPALWHDINHLTERGAAVYSRLLGLAVKSLVDRRPVPR